MEILISGGTGFIGQALTEHFLSQGHRLVIIGRDHQKIKSLFDLNVEGHTWDNFNKVKNDLLGSVDLIINLAGANIASERWTHKRKQQIIDSRIKSTQLLAEACSRLGKNSPPLFNASGVSIYGFQQSEKNSTRPFTESAPLTHSESSLPFMVSLARAWEEATANAKKHQVRVVNMRFAPVLGKEGLLKKLELPYRLGLGGSIGNGLQPFPWIALPDLIAGIDFLIRETAIEGPVNFAAPEYITQIQFAKALGEVLHRPTFMHLPEIAAKLLLGKEMAENLLLNGQWAEPEVLLQHGFHFRFTDIKQALSDILS